MEIHISLYYLTQIGQFTLYYLIQIAPFTQYVITQAGDCDGIISTFVILWNDTLYKYTELWVADLLQTVQLSRELNEKYFNSQIKDARPLEDRESWFGEITHYLQCRKRRTKKSKNKMLSQWLENAVDLFVDVRQLLSTFLAQFIIQRLGQ